MFDSLHPPPPSLLPQDLHIHTTFSLPDDAVVAEQTVALVEFFPHAQVLGISDHIEPVSPRYIEYRDTVRRHGLRLGIQVRGAAWVNAALDMDVDYFVYQCSDAAADYKGADKLLSASKPVIIAHPLVSGTNLDRISDDCVIEINNRYVWRHDWRAGFADHKARFKFVLSSDAHKPHWLNQHVARSVAHNLGIKETLLFPPSVV